MVISILNGHGFYTLNVDNGVCVDHGVRWSPHCGHLLKSFVLNFFLYIRKCNVRFHKHDAVRSKLISYWNSVMNHSE